MNGKETKFRFLNRTTLQIIGVLLILCAAVMLLWRGNATSNQAMPAMVAQVYFDGEYRIADGEWKKIVDGEHISSTAGDVTLRGNFHMLAPDGEYVGIYSGDVPIALYTNHIKILCTEIPPVVWAGLPIRLRPEAKNRSRSLFITRIALVTKRLLTRCFPQRRYGRISNLKKAFSTAEIPKETSA